MEKEFVPYELAVKLKELGFNEPCLTCYDKLEMIASHSKNVFDYKNYNTSGYMVSRPKLSQAFKWFREKHDLPSNLELLESGWDYVIYTDVIEEINYGDGPFQTYEEAELACLIKLIEIVEQQKQN